MPGMGWAGDYLPAGGENHLTTNEPNWRDHAALSWKPHFLTVQTTKLN